MSGSVSVRMYNVGFGDSFLLTFPGPDRPRKVLIDCGFHPAGPPPVRPLSKVVDQIVEDVTEGGEPRIDVVVCTHRHKDHVFGFEQDQWSGVRVSEVWMPWTEDPDDPDARRIREAQAKKAAALMVALAASPANDAPAARARKLAENSLSNAKAMAMLHRGFLGGAQRLFLPEKQGDGLKRKMNPSPLPGVTVHVLGPSRDKDVIRDMNPPVGESFLRMAAGGSALGAPPLDDQWAISARGEAFRKWFEDVAKAASRLRPTPDQPLRTSDPDFAPRWFGTLGLRWDDIKKIDHFAEDDPLGAAVAIEQAVNGTSLMLVFEVGRAVMLFPGDAQWGTWHRAMDDPISRAVMARANFVKVGHHGSHNATPRTFVEDVLGTEFQAMVSTRPTKLFKNIPRGPLMTRLLEKSARVVRSDSAEVAAPFVKVSDICIEAKVEI